MPDGVINVILTLITALFGAGGIVAWRKAGSEAKNAAAKIAAESKNAHDQIMAEAHKVTASTVVSALKAALEEQRVHLAAVSAELADLDRRLAQEQELRDALKDRAELLEDKVSNQARQIAAQDVKIKEQDVKIKQQDAKIAALEGERARWRRERADLVKESEALKARILELEGCK